MGGYSIITNNIIIIPIPKSRSSPSLDGSADKYLGIGSLRSESDILVSEDELSGDEYQSAGVIGQITPPRVIQSPTTVRVPTGLTFYFLVLFYYLQIQSFQILHKVIVNKAQMILVTISTN